MRIAVIGRGLIGSAAARHLAGAGHEVLLVGPSEPAELAAHRGVFGSHYDEGRITRRNATHPFWSQVSSAAIDRYAEIEAASGIAFFTPCGAMMAGAAKDAFFRDAASVSADRGIACRRLDRAQLAAEFPWFTFPGDFAALYEPTQAGHISPRRLVAAQTRAAERLGAAVIDSVVERVEDVPGGLVLLTPNQRIAIDQALVATGGMTDHVLPAPLGLEVRGRTVVFFEVSEATARDLATMPSLVFRWDDRSEPYLLPPIRYPDGRLYIKLGGDPANRRLTSAQAIGDWFRGGGDPVVRDYLVAMFGALMPGVEVLSTRMVPCMTTYTRSGLPVIERLTARLSVATGGNGAGAKCSDELGRLAAELVQGATHETLKNNA